MARLGVWDYFVILLYLVGVVAVGLVFTRRQKSLKEYIFAGGNMPWWLVSLSLFAGNFSPVSFLGVTGWILLKDSRYVVGGSIVRLILIPLFALFWIPVWHHLKLYSIYEYLERRYNHVVRLFGVLIFLVLMVFWAGNGLVAMAMAMEAVSGISVDICLVGIVLIGILYTSLGGARAVIWTDVLQFFVMIFSFIVIGVLLLNYFGWDAAEIYRIASSNISKVTGKASTTLVSTEFSLAIEGTIWAVIFMNVFNSLSLGANQMMIQRVLATDGKRRMMTALFVNQLISTIVMIFIAMVAWGLVAFCSVNSAAASRIEHTDKLVAWYIVHYVPAGAKGLILAGLLGAMMSTFDSVLNSLSTVTLNDFYERYLFKRRSDHHYVNVAKILTVVWGLIILLFSLWQAQRSDKTVIERLGRVNVLLASPVFCFFILGLFSKRVNTAGALIGGFMGIVSAVVISGFPGIIEKPFDINVNWMWVGAFATAISFVSGYFSSFLFAKPKASSLTGLTIYGITESSD